MDISFISGQDKFNYRVCAIILSGNRILAMHDERSPYYYLPGGRVRMGETAEHAVVREVEEELNRDLLDYGRGILSAPESAKMKTAYIAAPLVGSIYCGSPEEEEENVEEYVSLPVSLFGKGDFYILRAKGDSMVDAGIAEGNLLVIERNCPASEGDIVVALDQEQQNTLKRYVGFDNDEKCFILAYENEARYPEEVIKLKSFEVQGVARHVIKAL